MAKKRKRRGVSPKRNKMLRGVAQGMSLSAASRYAGYSSPQAGHKAFTSMRSEMTESAIRQGMNVDRLMKFLITKTEAKKIELVTFQGSITEKYQHEAHEVQLDAADKFIRIFDGYARRDDEGLDKAPANPIFNIIVGLRDTGRAERVIADARERVSVSDLGQPSMDVTLDEDEGRSRS